MTQQQIIEQKLTSLTPKEVILAMVNGLRKRHTIIDMSTYGLLTIDLEGKRLCFGCAATNALIEATGCEVEFAVGVHFNRTLDEFEVAVNGLRSGSIEDFNVCWPYCNMTNHKGIVLPYLADDYTEKELEVYERLAESQNY